MRSTLIAIATSFLITGVSLSIGRDQVPKAEEATIIEGKIDITNSFDFEAPIEVETENDISGEQPNSTSGSYWAWIGGHHQYLVGTASSARRCHNRSLNLETAEGRFRWSNAYPVYNYSYQLAWTGWGWAYQPVIVGLSHFQCWAHFGDGDSRNGQVFP